MSATNSAISTLTENNVETSSKQGKCVISTDIIDLYIVPTELLSKRGVEVLIVVGLPFHVYYDVL